MKPSLQFRHAVGRRHSQDDLDNLTSAHDALREAGCRCGDNLTAEAQGGSPEHQQKLDLAHDAIVAAAPEVCDDADSVDTSDGSTREPVRTRYAQARPAPDPYAKATARAASIHAALSPTTSSGYQPKGIPADPYAVAFALRAALANDEAVPTLAPMVRDAAGVPDGYATALKVKHGHN